MATYTAFILAEQDTAQRGSGRNMLGMAEHHRCHQHRAIEEEVYGGGVWRFVSAEQAAGHRSRAFTALAFKDSVPIEIRWYPALVDQHAIDEGQGRFQMTGTQPQFPVGFDVQIEFGTGTQAEAVPHRFGQHQTTGFIDG
ncbi:MAG TPA: hypothetical protein VGD78_15895 [Chthoniobacterales bacterium]